MSGAAARCAVIGAGAAGLSAARYLQAQGVAVTVFDKGRKPGGRLASRDTAFGSFDHGAPGFANSELTPATAPVQPWPPPSAAKAAPSLTGVPSINQLSQHWAAGLVVKLSSPVQSLVPAPEGWWLQLAGEAAPEYFDTALITVPAPQVQALLPQTVLPTELQRIAYDPCWTLLWTPAAATPPARPLWQPLGHSSLGWLVREDLKPGRSGPPRYVVHATPAWSAAQLEQPAEAVCAALLAEAAQALGIAPGAHYAAAHRWRYAQVRISLGRAQLRLAHGLHYASDGCLQGGVAQALRSGEAAAEALLASTL